MTASPDELILPEASIEQIGPVWVEAERVLANLAMRPLTPRMIIEVLHISSQERPRWTKDGRLKTIGQVLAQRSHSVPVALYDAAIVAELSADPGRIAAWRHQDALRHD